MSVGNILQHLYPDRYLTLNQSPLKLSRQMLIVQKQDERLWEHPVLIFHGARKFANGVNSSVYRAECVNCKNTKAAVLKWHYMLAINSFLWIASFMPLANKMLLGLICAHHYAQKNVPFPYGEGKF